MRDNLTSQFLEQLSKILESYESLKEKSKYDDLSDLGLQVAYRLLTQAKAAVERISGRDSAYSRQIDSIHTKTNEHDYSKLIMIIGVVQSLQNDLQYGFLTSVTEIIHGEIFADLLEMADYLLKEGFKDAAAVIGGGTLESHLRQLCNKHSVEIEVMTTTIQFKKADQLNSDLVKVNAYSKLDHKNVTAWLDLRNKAAHGQYSTYTKEQVALFLSGIRDFITRNPA